MPDAKAPGRHWLDAASSRRCTSRVPPETRTRACTMRKKGSSTTTRPAHVHTNAPSAPTGGGGGGGDETIETTVGALPLWDVTAAAPKWAPPTSLCTKAGAKAVLEDARVAATIECARAGYLEKLRKMLNRLATQKGAGAPPPQAFERWRFAAKHAEDASSSIDPVIPNGDTEGGAAAFNALVDDLTRAGVSSSSAKAIASQLAEAAGRYARLCRRSQAVLASCQHPWTEESSRGGDDDSGDDSDASDDDDDDDDDVDSDGDTAGEKRRGGLIRVAVGFRARSVELRSTRGKHFAVLSRRAYGKLAAMYRRSAPASDPGLPAPPEGIGGKESYNDKHDDDESGSSDDSDDSDDDDDERRAMFGDEESALVNAAANVVDSLNDDASNEPKSYVVFHARLFALLLRYKSIHGYGFQASVGPEVFELLRRTVGAQVECFASPLNAFHGRYHSAFPDVDGPFGSCGDFFRYCADKIRRGSFQVNPPFVSDVMSDAYDAMATALNAADEADSPLTFVVFVPGWTETSAWRKLTASTHTRNSFVVAASDHGYLDGAAHQRKNAYRTSVYDTGVFVLQSRRAVGTNAGKTIAAEGGKRFERAMRLALGHARRRARRAEDRVKSREKEREVRREEKARRTAEMREKRSEGKKGKKRRASDGDGDEDTAGDGGERRKGEKKKESKAAKARRKRREAAGWTKGRNGAGKRRAPKPDSN